MPRVTLRLLSGLAGVFAAPLLAQAQGRDMKAPFAGELAAPAMRLRLERFQVGLGVGARGITADSLRVLAAAERTARLLAVRRALAPHDTPSVSGSDAPTHLECPMPIASRSPGATAEMPVWRADSLVERRSVPSAQVRACTNALGPAPTR